MQQQYSEVFTLWKQEVQDSALSGQFSYTAELRYSDNIN